MAWGEVFLHPFSGVEARRILLSYQTVPPSDYRVVLGAAIRTRRERLHLSQERLAEKADLYPNYVGRVERGEENVSLMALRRVAKALGIRVRILVRDI